MFQLFDALAFAVAYIIAAAVLLGQADLRLLVPLMLWLVLYLVLLRWVIRRITPASEAASNARSAVTGRVVDSYTNIHAVKMFAHHDREIDYAKEAIEEARRTFQIEMRLYTTMDAGADAAERCLDCGCRWLVHLALDAGAWRLLVWLLSRPRLRCV